jgi:hypothetical protein
LSSPPAPSTPNPTAQIVLSPAPAGGGGSPPTNPPYAKQQRTHWPTPFSIHQNNNKPSLVGPATPQILRPVARSTPIPFRLPNAATHAGHHSVFSAEKGRSGKKKSKKKKGKKGKKNGSKKSGSKKSGSKSKGKGGKGKKSKKSKGTGNSQWEG